MNEAIFLPIKRQTTSLDLVNEGVESQLKKTLAAIAAVTKGNLFSISSWLNVMWKTINTWLCEAREMQRRLDEAKNEHFLRNQFYIR